MVVLAIWRMCLLAKVPALRQKWRMTRPAPSARADYPYLMPIQTRWLDNDVYGHVNNTVHYTWFDTAANAWLIDQGLLSPSDGAIIGVMVASGCTYFSEISYPQVVHLGVRIAKIGGSSVRYEFGCFAGDAQTSAADGTFTHVYVDAASRRPVPLPDAWRAKMAALTSSETP